MIIFRRPRTAQLVGAFGVFALPMANFDQLTDATRYVITGPLQDPNPRVVLSDPHARALVSDPSPRVVITEPESSV